MSQRVLSVPRYVAEFIEPPAPGTVYLVEERLVYRGQQGEWEDVHRLPATWDVVHVRLPALKQGYYLAERQAARQVAALTARLQVIANTLERLLEAEEAGEADFAAVPQEEDCAKAATPKPPADLSPAPTQYAPRWHHPAEESPSTPTSHPAPAVHP